MWDTMIPRAFQDFIKTDQIRRKLEWDIKENTALNLIQDFLIEGHLDLEMQRLIRLNHTFYKFIFSTASNIIYHNLKEIQTQEDGYLHHRRQVVFNSKYLLKFCNMLPTL